METRYFIMSQTKRVPMMPRRFSISAWTGRVLVAAALAAATLHGCATPQPAEPPARWKVAEIQTEVESEDCCPALAAAGFALLAARDMAMPGNSLRIALGCRPAGDGIEVASMLQLKVFSRTLESETFESANSDTIFACEDGFLSLGASLFDLIRQVSEIQAISGVADEKLCEIASRRRGPVPLAVLMRALEELAVRNNTDCVAAVEELALSSSGDLALRAIGTLGRLKVPRTVLTLGRLTLSNEGSIAWAATYAIADIGGPDAVRALEIIAGQSVRPTLGLEAARLAESLRERGR